MANICYRKETCKTCPHYRLDVNELNNACFLKKDLMPICLSHYTVHSLRHSYASLMINHLPLASLSKRIGHSQISTTLNVYTHQMSNQTKIKNLKNVIHDSNNNELISALNILRQYHIITDEEYQIKINIINTLYKDF